MNDETQNTQATEQQGNAATTTATNDAAEPGKKYSPVDHFRLTLQRMSAEFRAVLPPQIPVERFMRTTLTAVQMNPDLLDANRRTLLGACMKAAQDGLLPDGREAAFVMFNAKAGGMSVQYMPMVSGLFKKARNSGEIASISAHVVYSKDHFEYVLGDDEKIDHKPCLDADRGEPIAAYAIGKTKDGGIYREVMSKSDIEKVRNVSKAKGDGPWVTWWSEMARKTVFRRLAKRLPSSADLEQSLQHDNEAGGFVQLAAVDGLDDPAAIAPPKPTRKGASRTRQLIADEHGSVAERDPHTGDLLGSNTADALGSQP